MENREIKFEYGFESVNGIVKKVYALSEIPNIKEKCDVWNVLPIVYVRQFTGLTDNKRTLEYPNGQDVYSGDFDTNYNVVAWCDSRSGWAMKNYDFPTKEFISCHCYDCEGNFEINEHEAEIIGNIHDNPELLNQTP